MCAVALGSTGTWPARRSDAFAVPSAVWELSTRASTTEAMLAGISGVATRILPRHHCSVGAREEELVAVGIVDLEGVVAPPGFPGGNRAFRELASKVRECFRGQLDE